MTNLTTASQTTTKPSKKVVTITLNPALDLTGSLQTLVSGGVNLVERSDFHAAGKGVNVARVLCDLGAQVTVTGFLGQDNQTLFCQLFEDMGATDRFIRVEGSTRINVKLVENNGAVSDINFPGVTVSQQAIAQFEQTLDELCLDHDFFVLAGSLPNGVNAQMCADWVHKLRQKGKKVLFDSSRAALSAGIEAAPWLIKPNDEELAEFSGQAIETHNDVTKIAEQLANKGIENIVVSLGAKGVMWLNQGEWLASKPPKMTVVSTVGAGDTLVAGLCWGHMQHMDKTQLLSFATALSALAVSQVGVGVPDIAEVITLQQQVQINPISSEFE
ncbi:1-phosphofructokinase [Vibrio ichthyoenteri ATCC 700023]|uniref:Phosphofructokinase n=1 Tax=Vibrio ichthyoenteri ATCC 700023 TaxID=870968 RepID=F9RXL7_9VIBR|nr:1-phosphofructokinase [Vibrio ichthyoenteri]EGU47797.1 1-phosphofructokinase [Vibrio ichthyoenteri ATCC 700023]